MTNSRFITYPSTVEKESNTTIVLVDADMDDIASIGSFCQTSHKNYDIYLYKAATGDLEWLQYLGNRVDQIFIRQGSTVNITDATYYTSINDLKEYFTRIDGKTLTVA